MIRKSFSWMFFLAFLGCNTISGKKGLNENPEDLSNKIIEESIEAHGGKSFKNIEISFDFRGKAYQAIHEGNSFRYSRSFKDSSGVSITDILDNYGFVRLSNGDTAYLSKKNENAYRQAVNSVHYFNELPFRLSDPAVKSEYLGEVIISGKTYDKIRVTFEKAGGGDDFNDVFIYWFEKDSHMLDFLAYEYHVDEGGIRFREAVNRRTIGGIVFQDYINYKADPSTYSLLETDELFEKGELEKLSEIINTNITVRELSQ